MITFNAATFDAQQFGLAMSTAIRAGLDSLPKSAVVKRSALEWVYREAMKRPAAVLKRLPKTGTITLRDIIDAVLAVLSIIFPVFAPIIALVAFILHLLFPKAAATVGVGKKSKASKKFNRVALKNSRQLAKTKRRRK